jgi:hypothetical protein
VGAFDSDDDDDDVVVVVYLCPVKIIVPIPCSEHFLKEFETPFEHSC